MNDKTYLSIIHFIYRRLYYSGYKQTLCGRLVDPEKPRGRRFLDQEVDAVVADTWPEVRRILPAAQLEQYRNRGSQANVVGVAVTVASYRVLRAFGLDRDYAIELCGDATWRAYTRLGKLPKVLAKVRSWDLQSRLNLILRLLLRYPFASAGPPGEGRPGYEAEARWEPDGFYLTFTSCAPLNFIRQYIDEHGDDGELNLFQQTWCTYDWPFADVLVGRPAHYERPHTLSFGDDRCDMVWSATPQPERLLPMARSEPDGHRQPV